MKKIAILLLAVFALRPAAAAVYNQDNFSASGRMYEPSPRGIRPGGDNASGSGMHHVGEECGRCHSMGKRAESRLWTMAGTLYYDRSGRCVQKGGEILLEDRDGNVISLTSNEAGNFWTTAPIGSNPYAVVSHGGPPEPMYTLDADGKLRPRRIPG